MQNYTNIEYARSRLVQTVVRVGGKAAYVEELTKTTVKWSDFIEGKSSSSKIAEMDITPVPLGYCNTMGLTTYLVRYPVRQDWKQGLRHKTLKTIGPKALRVTSDMIPWVDVFKTINGVYPKFLEVVKHLHDNKDIRSEAYCRDFAIYQDMTIMYKEQFIIGTVEDVNANDGVVSIKEEFEWIRDAFEASVEW